MGDDHSESGSCVGTFGKELAVRKALLYALDRDSIVKDILGGVATRADGMQPMMSRAYAPDQLTTIYNYNPEKAKTLLDEAG
ncbi:MAG: ABC transporter substrate-binding protein [Thermomicrobiales bacterium]